MISTKDCIDYINYQITVLEDELSHYESVEFDNVMVSQIKADLNYFREILSKLTINNKIDSGIITGAMTFPIFLSNELLFHARKKDIINECDFFDQTQTVSLEAYKCIMLRKIKEKYITEFNFNIVEDLFDNRYDFDIWFDKICEEMYIEKLKAYTSNKEVS